MGARMLQYCCIVLLFCTVVVLTQSNSGYQPPGSGSNGAPPGAGSNGAPPPGSGSLQPTGSPSNGSPSNGAPSNGAPSNGAPSNGAPSMAPTTGSGSQTPVVPPGSGSGGPTAPSTASTGSNTAPSAGSVQPPTTGSGSQQPGSGSVQQPTVPSGSVQQPTPPAPPVVQPAPPVVQPAPPVVQPVQPAAPVKPPPPPPPPPNGGFNNWGTCDSFEAESTNEGMCAHRYKDSVGIYTIGIGFNLQQSDAATIMASCGGDINALNSGPDNCHYTGISSQLCSNTLATCLLNVELAKSETCIKTLMGTSFNTLPKQVVSGLIDMAYNMGCAGLGTFTNTIAMLKAGNYAGAASNAKQSKWCTQVGSRCTRTTACLGQGGPPPPPPVSNPTAPAPPHPQPLPPVGPAPSEGYFGIDIQLGINPTPAQWSCMHTTGNYQFAIIEVWNGGHGLNTNIKTNINNAWAAGFQSVDVYSFMCPNCNNPASASVQKVVAALQGVNYGRLWLDIEQCTGCWYTSMAQNVAYIDSLIAAYTAAGVKLGIYTSPGEWPMTTGGVSKYASSYILWYANYDGAVNFADFKSGFGGWTAPHMKQFADHADNSCSINVDRNWRPTLTL